MYIIVQKPHHRQDEQDCITGMTMSWTRPYDWLDRIVQDHVTCSTVSYTRPYRRQEDVAGTTTLRVKLRHTAGNTTLWIGPCHTRDHTRARIGYGQDHVAGKTAWRARPRGGQDHVLGKTSWRTRPRREQDHVADKTASLCHVAARFARCAKYRDGAPTWPGEENTLG